MPLFSNSNNFEIRSPSASCHVDFHNLEAFLRKYGYPSAHVDLSDPPITGKPDPNFDSLAINIINWGKSTINTLHTTNAPSANHEKLLWVNGPPGVGKSVLADVCAQTLMEKHSVKLAKFFFCEPVGVIDPCRFIPTIAYQFANKIPDYRQALIQKLIQDPSIGTKDPLTQFQYLLSEPIGRIYSRRAGTPWTGVVIMIDGLDECDCPEHRSGILDAISSTVQDQTSPFRWAVFSRPDSKPISDFFCREDISLSCLLFSIVGDVKRLFDDGFKCIKPPFRKPHPPSKLTMDRLIAATKRNFTLAELFVRFVSFNRENCESIEDSLAPLLEIIDNAPNDSGHPYLNYFYDKVLRHTIPITLHKPSQKLLAIVLHAEQNRVQCSRGLLMDLLGLDESIFEPLRSALDVVLDAKRKPKFEPDDSFSVMPLFHSSGPSSARQQTRPFVQSKLESDIVPHHRQLFDTLIRKDQGDSFGVRAPILLRSIFASYLDLQSKYDRAYTISIASWDLPENLPYSLRSMAWPCKNENAEIFLKASAYDRLFSMGYAFCYSFSNELGHLLKRFGSLDHKKRIIIQGLIAYEGAPTAYVRYGCSGILRNIRGSLLFRISSDEFDKFDFKKFRKMIRLFHHGNVIRPYDNPLSSLHRRLSRPDSNKKLESGLYVLGHGRGKVYWYWEWDPLLKYFQQYETLKEEEAVEVYRGKRLTV